MDMHGVIAIDRQFNFLMSAFEAHKQHARQTHALSISIASYRLISFKS